MKRIFLVLSCVLMCVTGFTQSLDIQFSKDGPKTLAEYFIAKDRYNVFSYSEFGFDYDDNCTYGLSLTYAEFRIANSNFYVHPEVRFNTNNCGQYYIGFAYKLPVNAVNVYVTPMYRRYGETNSFQLSVNTCGDYRRWYYQGYFDLYTIGGASFFTEQRFYYKVVSGLQVGVNLTCGADTEGEFSFNPFGCLRYAF